RADVHVRAGTIVAVGPDLAAPAAEVIDGQAMIALPGLIDTHNHLWTSSWRNLAMEGPEKGYFPVTLALGRECTPEDMYRSVRLGMASRSLSNSPRGAGRFDVIRRDWEGARALGLPITIHTGDGSMIAAFDREKMLGPDVQLVHPGAWTEADLGTVVRTGVHV